MSINRVEHYLSCLLALVLLLLWIICPCALSIFHCFRELCTNVWNITILSFLVFCDTIPRSLLLLLCPHKGWWSSALCSSHSYSFLSNPYRSLSTLPEWKLKRSRDRDCLVSNTDCPALPGNEGAPGTFSAQTGTVLSKPKWSVTLRGRRSLKGILAHFSVLSFLRQMFEARVVTCIDTLEPIKWTANPRIVPFPAVLLPNPFHPFGRFLCSSVSRELST